MEKDEELRRELADAADFRQRHPDPEKRERKEYLRKILLHGTEREFIEALRICGWGEETPEGRKFLTEFRKIRGL